MGSGYVIPRGLGSLGFSALPWLLGTNPTFGYRQTALHEVADPASRGI